MTKSIKLGQVDFGILIVCWSDAKRSDGTDQRKKVPSRCNLEIVNDAGGGAPLEDVHFAAHADVVVGRIWRPPARRTCARALRHVSLPTSHVRLKHEVLLSNARSRLRFPTAVQLTCTSTVPLLLTRPLGHRRIRAWVHVWISPEILLGKKANKISRDLDVEPSVVSVVTVHVDVHHPVVLAVPVRESVKFRTNRPGWDPRNSAPLTRTRALFSADPILYQETGVLTNILVERLVSVGTGRVGCPRGGRTLRRRAFERALRVAADVRKSHSQRNVIARFFGQLQTCPSSAPVQSKWLSPTAQAW